MEASITGTHGPLHISGGPSASFDASTPEGRVQFKLLYEQREDWQDPEVLRGPVKISVSPHGQLVLIERGDGGMVEGGSEKYGCNWNEWDNLIGRLLTLVDATFGDPEQRKAFKDMVRQQVKEWAQGVMESAAYDARMERNISAPFVGGITESAKVAGRDVDLG